MIGTHRVGGGYSCGVLALCPTGNFFTTKKNLVWKFTKRETGIKGGKNRWKIDPDEPSGHLTLGPFWTYIHQTTLQDTTERTCENDLRILFILRFPRECPVNMILFIIPCWRSYLHLSIISTKSTGKYTNPARGILDFCKQKLWPLPYSQLTN